MTEPIPPDRRSADDDEPVGPPPEAFDDPPPPPQPLPESLFQPEPPRSAPAAESTPAPAVASPFSRSDEQLFAVGGRLVLAFVLLLLVAGTVASVGALIWLIWKAFHQ